MTEIGTILFLCPHGAAKSVLAAAEFERLARERGLCFRATSAGTEPDDVTSPAVVAALLDDGIDVSTHRPRRVTQEDIARAHRVISLGCNVDGLASGATRITRWDEVPPVSVDLDRARAVIRQHVATLLAELEREPAVGDNAAQVMP
jgi:arsenate reductase (thioredoxin)